MPAIPHYFSWQLSVPDRFGNMTLFNAGNSEAFNIRLEPDNSARVEPQTFHQPHIPTSGTSDRFKVLRAGGAKRPSIRILWQDKERQSYTVVIEVVI